MEDPTQQARRNADSPMTKFGVLALAGLACMISPWIPEPIGPRSYFVSLIGFGLLIIAGHRAAFRHDKAGIFAFWFRPVQMSKASLDSKEKQLMRVGLVLAIVPILAILLKEVLI